MAQGLPATCILDIPRRRCATVVVVVVTALAMRFAQGLRLCAHMAEMSGESGRLAADPVPVHLENNPRLVSMTWAMVLWIFSDLRGILTRVKIHF